MKFILLAGNQLRIKYKESSLEADILTDLGGTIESEEMDEVKTDDLEGRGVGRNSSEARHLRLYMGEHVSHDLSTPRPWGSAYAYTRFFSSQHCVDYVTSFAHHDLTFSPLNEPGSLAPYSIHTLKTCHFAGIASLNVFFFSYEFPVSRKSLLAPLSLSSTSL